MDTISNEILFKIFDELPKYGFTLWCVCRHWRIILQSRKTTTYKYNYLNYVVSLSLIKWLDDMKKVQFDDLLSVAIAKKGTVDVMNWARFTNIKWVRYCDWLYEMRKDPKFYGPLLFGKEPKWIPVSRIKWFWVHRSIAYRYNNTKLVEWTDINEPQLLHQPSGITSNDPACTYYAMADGTYYGRKSNRQCIQGYIYI